MLCFFVALAGSSLPGFGSSLSDFDSEQKLPKKETSHSLPLQPILRRPRQSDLAECRENGEVPFEKLTERNSLNSNQGKCETSFDWQTVDQILGG